MALQDSLSNKTYKWKRQLFDINIDYLGNEIKAIMFSEEEINHYGDKVLTISEDKLINVIIDYPGEELPITSDGDNSQFHLYDVLPIEVFTKFQDSIKFGTILVHKISITDDNSKLIALRISNQISKADGKNVVWNKWQAAPYNLNLDDFPELENTFQTYLDT